MEVLSSDGQMALPSPRKTTDLSYEQVTEPHDEQMTGADVDASLLTARFKDQTTKDWTSPTHFDDYLKSKPEPVKWMKDLIRDYEYSNCSFSEIISEIPFVTGWVHSALPQFKRYANQGCLLLLGFCPQYGETIPVEGVASLVTADPNLCFTDVFSGSIGQIFGNTISLCVRKSCRKAKNFERGSKTYQACLPVGQTESIYLFMATKLEVLIGRKEFGINFTSCIAFSSATQDIASFLDLQVWRINDPSIIGRASVYSMWLAGLGLVAIAKDLAKIDGRKPEDVYETLRQSIVKARPKWSQVKKWKAEPELIQPELSESELTEERMLRRRAIAEAMKDDYDPQRRKKGNKRLEGPLTKTQERARKKHQSQAHKDGKKRYAESQKGKVRRRARDQERKVEAKIPV